MKKIILISLIILTGCATNPVSLTDMKPKGREIPNKIKPLKTTLPNEREIVATKDTNVLSSEDKFSAIFGRTLEKNVFSDDGLQKWGYIELKSTFYENKLIGYEVGTYFHSLFLGIPSILGIPVYSQTLDMEFEVSIYNSKKDRIKKYVLQESAKQVSGLYYNWEQLNYLTHFHNLLRELENEISLDADYINNELIKAGPISIEEKSD